MFKYSILLHRRRRRSRSLSSRHQKSRSPTPRRRKSRSPTPRRHKRQRTRSISLSASPAVSVGIKEQKDISEKLRKEEEEKKRYKCSSISIHVIFLFLFFPSRTWEHLVISTGVNCKNNILSKHIFIHRLWIYVSEYCKFFGSLVFLFEVLNMCLVKMTLSWSWILIKVFTYFLYPVMTACCSNMWNCLTFPKFLQRLMALCPIFEHTIAKV